MTDEELVKQALAELGDVVRCRCHEAYKGRGLHDPDCQCDSAEALATVTKHIEALTAERDEHWKSFVHWRKEADALTEQLEAARADAKEAEAYAEELEAKVKNLTKHHANMADPRYWEGRYRDEKAKLAQAVSIAKRVTSFEDNTEELAECGCARCKAHLDLRTLLAEIEGSDAP
jgi:septal ring factor EnvC (AmiA/AmiB activator)